MKHLTVIIIPIIMMLYGCDDKKELSDLIVVGNIYKHTGAGISVTVREGVFPVTGLDVRVNDYVLQEYGYTKGLYSISQNTMPIESGVEFNLEIVYGENLVTATTTLPDTIFKIITPQENDVHPGSMPMEVVWNRSDVNARYVVFVQEIFPEMTNTRHLTNVLQDTSYTIPASVFNDTGFFTIQIFAVHDGMYYPREIFYGINSNVEPDVVGFFGAHVQRIVRIHVE
ncbi:MAG: hypothetical protein V3W18_05000 [candidate division Zixibacteria bacterium]